jgi:hypothetical protein
LNLITYPASIHIIIYSLSQLIFITHHILHQIVDKAVPSGKLSLRIAALRLFFRSLFILIAKTRSMGEPELHKDTERIGKHHQVAFITLKMPALQGPVGAVPTRSSRSWVAHW